MLYYTHCEFKALIHLTHNYKTSRAAHQRLEQIMKKECEKATKVDYGLQMLPETLLQIADDESIEWLLQPELKAIQDGLTYVSWKEERGHRRYRGYLNAQGQKQGVGIIWFDNLRELGEWHENEIHGIYKREWGGELSLWGQYKHGKKEGYITE